MKKLSLVLLALLSLTILTSCEPVMCEDCYTYTYSDGSVEWVCVEYDCSEDYAQDLGFSIAQDEFEGDYTNYETLVNGEVSDTCNTIWSFNSNGTMRIDRVEGCTDGPASSGVRQFTTDSENLYITMGAYTAAYPYTIESNGDLTLSLVTGNYTLIYKLTR